MPRKSADQEENDARGIFATLANEVITAGATIEVAGKYQCGVCSRGARRMRQMKKGETAPSCRTHTSKWRLVRPLRAAFRTRMW